MESATGTSHFQCPGFKSGGHLSAKNEPSPCAAVVREGCHAFTRVQNSDNSPNYPLFCPLAKGNSNGVSHRSSSNYFKSRSISGTYTYTYTYPYTYTYTGSESRFVVVTIFYLDG